jgi:alpha-amylase/alpha-mannosidase (GH57 family)
MWLAETAVDYETLEALVAEGIKFIVLAPSQAQRCRPIPTSEQPDPHWTEVGGSQIDPIQPYRCYLKGKPEPDLSDRLPNPDPLTPTTPYIDIFFYDGPISRDMGFNDVLTSSQHFAGRIGLAVRGDHRQSQLISVATDGETFGHHKGGSEKALAYALTQEFPQRQWTVTNYAHYLSLCLPTWEVELKPVTAWSCSHGVDRWQADCGCGGGGDWNQQWRKPLRESLNWLRGQLAKIFEETGQKFFRDPWQTRDDYISVILDRSPVNLHHFLVRHQTHKLTVTERTDALRLLEMQRHALLMFTSCGWFFDEISRPEGTQILRYAARAIELAGDVAGTQLEKAFVKRLANATSNVEQFQNGAEVYRQLVMPSQISLEQVAAHYAITSLFTPYAQEEHIYCYAVHRIDYQLQRLGALTLAVGQIHLTSEITRESSSLIVAVLHLGGWDFHCCIQPFTGRRAYSQLRDGLFDALKQASAAQTILAMSRAFGEQSYSLQDLFAEERHRIMRLLSQETLTRLDQLYTQVYRDNYGVLMAFHRDELEVPKELQVAAEIAISQRAITSLQALERDMSDFPPSHPQLCWSHLLELETIAQEARHLHCELSAPEIQKTLERLIVRLLWALFTQYEPETAALNIEWIDRLIKLGDQLHLHLSLDRAQEIYYKQFHDEILPEFSHQAPLEHLPETAVHQRVEQLRQVLHLGQQLAIDVDRWLTN